MTSFVIDRELYEALGGHLGARAEQVGFFLAKWDSTERSFLLREWRPVPLDGLEHQSDFHVSLGDEMRAEIIKWAWDSDLSLVEAHSHGNWVPAEFSGSDLWGFDEWVPHLWWRLRGRPYAALVTASDTFDAIAWIDGSRLPEQVDTLEVDGQESVAATGETFRHQAGRLSRDDRDAKEES
jgi:hypothetical protein